MEVVKTSEPDYEVVWEPIPNSSQELAIDTRCDHTLYDGTRGPGKTATQLMRFRRFVGIGYGSFLRGIIFDREFKNLSDLVAQSKKFYSLFEDGAKFMSSASDYKWVWPTGEELLFRHVKKLSDYDSYHGHEYPFIGWNELTKQPTCELYDKMMSTNRSSFVPEKHTPKLLDSKGKVEYSIDGVDYEGKRIPIYNTPDQKPLPPIPLQVFSTTNPSGPGHNWVKRRFINIAQHGEVVRRKTIVFDPKTQQDVEVTKTQVAIFGTYKENTYLDVRYIAELDRLTSNNINLRKAWLEGDWDFTAGGAIDDIWDRKIHVIPRFKIPENWRVDRSFDWGSTHPFSVCWWAETNGEDVVLDDGSILSFEKNSLIQIFEWYGTEEIGSNRGLKLSAPDIADGIIKREIELMENSYVAKQPFPGPADNQISNVTQKDVETIEKKMAKKGVCWTKSDKSAGSRKNGLQLFRDRLEASVKKEGGGIYFMQNCIGSIETLPSLPRDEREGKLDDVDTNSEDHVYDSVRYRVLKDNNRIVSSGSYY